MRKVNEYCLRKSHSTVNALRKTECAFTERRKYLTSVLSEFKTPGLDFLIGEESIN